MTKCYRRPRSRNRLSGVTDPKRKGAAEPMVPAFGPRMGNSYMKGLLPKDKEPSSIDLAKHGQWGVAVMDQMADFGVGGSSLKNAFAPQGRSFRGTSLEKPLVPGQKAGAGWHAQVSQSKPGLGRGLKLAGKGLDLGLNVLGSIDKGLNYKSAHGGDLGTVDKVAHGAGDFAAGAAMGPAGIVDHATGGHVSGLVSDGASSAVALASGDVDAMGRQAEHLMSSENDNVVSKGLAHLTARASETISGMDVYATEDMSRYVTDDQWYGTAGKDIPENAVGSGTAAGVVRATNNARKWDNNGAHQARVRDDSRRADEMRERNRIREQIKEDKVNTNLGDFGRAMIGGEVEVSDEEIDAQLEHQREIERAARDFLGLD
jgi:hypothetical protein